LVGKPKGKRPLGRPICRKEDNVKMDAREIGWGVVDWINLTLDREHDNEPSGSLKYWEIFEWGFHV
jgi:hypothetical protein